MLKAEINIYISLIYFSPLKFDKGNLDLMEDICQYFFFLKIANLFRRNLGPRVWISVAEHALFTWLITHLSRDITCTDHVALMH